MPSPRFSSRPEDERAESTNPWAHGSGGSGIWSTGDGTSATSCARCTSIVSRCTIPTTFGDTHRLVEQSRDAWGWNWLDDATQDVVVGIRTLLKSPSFAVTATLILSFGIGLNLTLYQMLQAALLRPPAIKSPDSVARFHRVEPHNRSTSIPYPVAEFVKENNSGPGGGDGRSGIEHWVGPRRRRTDRSSFVSTNWFDELGYGPLHGRLLSDALDTTADAPVVVLGYTFWQSRLGGDRTVVGRIAYLDRKPVTVVGVAPKEMPGLDFDVPDVFIPIAQREYFYPHSAFLQRVEYRNRRDVRALPPRSLPNGGPRGASIDDAGDRHGSTARSSRINGSSP